MTMDRTAIHERVTQLLVELFDVDPASVTLQARFDDLGLTSLDAIDLVVELQRLTGRKVSEAAMRKVRSVGDIVTLVEEHLGEGGPR